MYIVTLYSLFCTLCIFRFEVFVKFSIPNIVIEPALDSVQKALNHVTAAVLGVTKGALLSTKYGNQLQKLVMYLIGGIAFLMYLCTDVAVLGIGNLQVLHRLMQSGIL